MITLGIDIGSTTSKCVLMRDGQDIIASSLRIGGLGTEGPAEALAELWEKQELLPKMWTALLLPDTDVISMKARTEK